MVFQNGIKSIEAAAYNGACTVLYQEFGSAVVVCSIDENSGPQNIWVSIVLKASKSVGAKIYGFVLPLHPC